MDGVEGTVEFSGMLGLLERVGRTLDLMWRSAVADRSDAAMFLAEASHGVHRAIIALSAPAGPPPQPGVPAIVVLPEAQWTGLDAPAPVRC